MPSCGQIIPALFVTAGLTTSHLEAQQPVPTPRAGVMTMAGPGAMRLVEQTAPQPAVLTDGTRVMLETSREWRLMCSSPTDRLTHDDFIDIIDSARAPLIDAPPNEPAPAVRGQGLNIIFNQVGFVPGSAQQALADMETYIEALFDDPIVVSINISFQNLGFGVLGATGTTNVGSNYNAVRAGLAAGADDNDDVQAFLPPGSTLPVRFVSTSDIVSQVAPVTVSHANFNATVGTLSGVAATMTFNSSTNFDYDPSNGVSGTCFRSVIVHEVGHALGFVSAIDTPGNNVRLLDVFRFQSTDGFGDFNPDSLDEFQTTPRLAAFNSPNNQHITDLGTVEYPMSDGSPSQASHFTEGFNGIMDPSLAPGQTFFPNYFRTSDLNVLDAIGYDYPPINGGGGGLPPVAVDDTRPITGGLPIVLPFALLTLNDFDPDGGDVTVQSLATPDFGSITTNANETFTYTPPSPYFVGDAHVEYTITDEDEEQATALLTLNLLPNNTVCPCNLDDPANGEPDVLDLLAFLDGYLGTTGNTVAPTSGADIDGSGDIGILDLLTFLECWLPASNGAGC